ncbi:MAG TPA: PAS domain S-box protein [Solirubrobacteraceae bacterium]
MSDLGDRVRLPALDVSGPMDAPPHEAFDRLTRLASRLLGAPVAAITLAGGDREVVTSAVGIQRTETPAARSLCRRVIADAAALVARDAPDGGAFCGVPLTDDAGHTLGAFWAMGPAPREWSGDDIALLTELARSAVTELELQASRRALGAREHETRALIDGVQDAFLACDGEGRILDWNPAAERLFGLSADEAIGQSVAETILPSNRREQYATELARHTVTGESSLVGPPVELYVVHRSGRLVQVEMTMAFVDSATGPRFTALIRNVAERKAAQRRSAQLAQVVQSTHDAVITIDRAGRITSWNAGAEMVYGYTADEMVGYSHADRIDERRGNDEQTDQLLPQLLAGRYVTARAVPRRHQDGRRIHVDLSAAPLFDAAGEIVGATSITRDVTEQHRLEIELEESEARFRETFDEAPIGIALVGPNGRWLAVNRVLCRILGYAESELLAAGFQDITHPDDLAADLDLVRRTLAGEIPTYQMEKRYFHKGGHTIWAKLSVALVRDSSGAPLHFVSHVEDITHAKAAELELAEGRRLLDESQAIAGVGSWSWNLETDDASWSAQQFQLHGLEPGSEAPSIRALRELVHPDDRDRITAAMTRHMAARAAFVDEYRVCLPEFGVRTLWVRGDFLPADPASGLPARMAGTTQDVTTERAAQIARDEIENRQGILLSSLPDTMVVLYDRDLRCTLVQGALLEQLQITPAEFEGRLLSEVVAPTRLHALEPFVVKALAGEPASIEYPSSDGRTYQVDIVPYRSELGEIGGAFTVWRDISDRLEREHQRQKLATIVEQCEDAIFAKSPDGIITEWNRGAQQLYGYAPAEAVGQPIAMLVPPERHGEEFELLERALAGDAITQYETTRLTKAGARVDVSISVSPLYGPDGSAVGASVVARDVTQRKQMEDDLRASRERALETSRLKSEFVANMSHEIRTPLNGVVSMAELLLDTELSPDQREYAQITLTSAEALMRVISDILDFSKIEAGKLEILNEDFSVRSALDDVSEIVGVKAVERGLQLEVSIADDIAEVVRGDGNRVRQVLMNLLSNAIKFTSEGGVRVRVDLQDEADGAPVARFEVSDTGIGIAPEQLVGLFQPFSQADATTTRRYGGTGLGLCISKQLVELMGGEITCQSEPGVGSRFSFTLPYQPGAGAEADLIGSDLTGTRVLIIDSIAAHRQMLQTCLASWGIIPDSAQDGAMAVQMLRRGAENGRPYEAALLELGTGGIELAREITAVPALRATRLITIGCVVDAVTARTAGIDAQLVKPVRPSKLYNELLRMQRRSTLAPDLLGKSDQVAGSVVDGGLRVLVAEDNEVNQFAAVRLLSRLGFSVDVATNGREAITMSGRVDYAAVFMDCQMPEVDGYTATRVIRRRDQRTRHTPIIALTAHALEGDREKCLAAGMDHYLTKPLRLKTLEALIGQVPALGREERPAVHEVDGLFDPSPLGEIGDPQTEAALAVMFLDQATERLPALMGAIESADAERLHALAHGLKGSAATVGAIRISELSRVLCDLAADGVTPAAAEIHVELADALSATSIAISGYIEKITAAA